MGLLPPSRIPRASQLFLLASTARLVSLLPNNVSGARGTSKKPECPPRHVLMASMVDSCLHFQSMGFQELALIAAVDEYTQPGGLARTKRVTAPMVHYYGFDKAIVYAALLQLPVAFG